LLFRRLIRPKALIKGVGHLDVPIFSLDELQISVGISIPEDEAMLMLGNADALEVGFISFLLQAVID
jgi:hypothetical protein